MKWGFWLALVVAPPLLGTARGEDAGAQNLAMGWTSAVGILCALLMACVLRALDKKTKKLASMEKLNERLRLNAEALSIGIWHWDDLEKGRQHWFPKFYALLGHGPGEIEPTRKTLLSMAHPEDGEKVLKFLDGHVENVGVSDVEFRIKTKSKGYRWFRNTTLTHRNEHGDPVHVVGSIQDIHDQVATMQSLKKSNEDLEQFAHIASHDLKEPLRGMRNFTEFLLEDYEDTLDDNGKKYLQTIKRQSDRLENYLNDLLVHAKISNDKLSFSKVDVSELIKSVHDMVVESTPKKVTIECPEELPSIFSDKTKLHIIFMNLIQNSIKYNNKEDVRIKILHKPMVGFSHKFSLIDNGIGIEKKHWRNIFTLFRRLHASQEHRRGNGIGAVLRSKGRHSPWGVNLGGAVRHGRRNHDLLHRDRNPPAPRRERLRRIALALLTEVAIPQQAPKAIRLDPP